METIGTAEEGLKLATVKAEESKQVVDQLLPIDPLLACIPLLWRWRVSILLLMCQLSPYLPSAALLSARLWLILSIAMRLLPISTVLQCPDVVGVV